MFTGQRKRKQQEGKLYPADVSLLFINEGVVKLLTSGLFSGDGSTGTERWGDSGSSPDDVGSIAAPDDVGSIAEGPLDSEDMSGLEDMFVVSSPIISVSFQSSSQSKLNQFNSSSSVSPLKRRSGCRRRIERF
ncbi:hypothetical protein MRB53_006670 [Persea americana]|uniref:Uncharacterized protein n=1 Tax=Persea americana TaxID=3435 RepID=A0ACC2MGP0_PERAE|nr:hypothetical protein MRB53_006670 [Persea americana]